MSFNCNSGSKHETQEASHVQGLDQILLVLSALCGHKSTYQSIGAMLLLPSSDDVHLCWWKGKMLQAFSNKCVFCDGVWEPGFPCFLPQERCVQMCLFESSLVLWLLPS